jgi:hypothetical protein
MWLPLKRGDGMDEDIPDPLEDTDWDEEEEEEFW